METQSGLITSSTGSWYSVRMSNGSEHQARLKGKFRLQGKELTNPLAVGDEVELDISDPQSYVITEIKPRRNYLIRRAAKQSSRYHIVASNIDQAMIIVTRKHPRTSNGFVDRFLVTCEAYGIEPVLLINKTDLLEKPELDEEHKRVRLYRELGYTVIEASLKVDGVSDALRSVLHGKRTLLFGHSGVGKSTLINIVVPEAAQQVTSISESLGKGKHTTTFARMLFFDEDLSSLIDTPGIKEFGLEPMEPWKLAHYFPEMKAVLSGCRFNNCLHRSEPGCAVQEALRDGRISKSRYESYIGIFESLDDEWGRN